MRKIIVSEFLSLDGVFEAPHTWHFPYISDDFNEFNMAGIHNSDIMLMGKATYEEFASVWPNMTQNEYGIADKLNNAPKYVVSKSLQKANWQNTEILRSVAGVQSMKAEGEGNIGMTGSGTLLQGLLQAKLIDQLDLLIHPIVVGKGKRLFPEGCPQIPLALSESRVFKSGVVLMRYVLA
jgi:dihydrofolate reductase